MDPGEGLLSEGDGDLENLGHGLVEGDVRGVLGVDGRLLLGLPRGVRGLELTAGIIIMYSGMLDGDEVPLSWLFCSSVSFM